MSYYKLLLLQICTLLILYIKNVRPQTESDDISIENLDYIAIENFQEYLRIPSVQPDVNYDDCVNFLKHQAESLNLKFNVYTVAPKKPVVIATWIGSEPNLPTILLNSHMDVVAVNKEFWTHDPFGAEIDENGDIYARGAQDAKSIGIQYLEAIRRLKSRGISLRRTVHVIFVPDEEIGGAQGMELFVKTDDFKALNVGVALDEGGTSDLKNFFFLLYGDRTVWQFRIHSRGKSGHASLMLNNTAGEKVTSILNNFYTFRKGEEEKLKNPLVQVYNVTTINLTGMKGGIETNVIPSELELTFDCRIPLNVDLERWEETINSWLEEAGEDVSIEYIQKQTHFPTTKLDNSNPYWVAFKKITKQMHMIILPIINPGITDSRFLRKAGIPAFGFAPINATTRRAHDNDEYLNKDVFLTGIEIYCQIISTFGNLQD